MAEAQQLTVLIVDDEEMIREAIAFDFNRKGFKVLSAGDGAQALNFIKNEKIDLVISDLWMPGCDGMSLLRQVRENQGSTPFIMMSGGTRLSEAECLRLGAQKFLSKPFDFKALQTSALELLGITSSNS